MRLAPAQLVCVDYTRLPKQAVVRSFKAARKPNDKVYQFKRSRLARLELKRRDKVVRTTHKKRYVPPRKMVPVRTTPGTKWYA